jgi:hypothetical protein
MLAVHASWEKKLQCQMRLFKVIAGGLTSQNNFLYAEKMQIFGCSVGMISHWEWDRV